MASVFPRDPQVVARKRGVLIGVGLAIAVTVVAYIAAWLPSNEFLQTIVLPLFLAPLIAGVLLLCIPRTRSLANGLLIGAVLTWIVSVPACVVVTLGTVPNILG